MNARRPTVPGFPLLALGLAPLFLALASCGGGDGGAVDPLEGCVDVAGVGETVGTVRALVGSGTFTFDGVARDVHVGVYLNDMRDIDHGRKALSIVYQFTWPNGDMILTEDDVIFTPQLEKDLYEFSTDLTVKDGKGLFAGIEGTSPFGIDAEVRFGPPPPGSNMRVASESFEIGGRFCQG